jgi:hypothetical protein
VRVLDETTISHAQYADTLRALREADIPPFVLCKATGFTESQIRHYIRVSRRLISEVKYLLHTNKIKFSLAKALASLPPDQQEETARQAIMNRISVHEFRDKAKSTPRGLDHRTVEYFKRLEQTIADQTGIVIEIIPDSDNKNAGYVKMRYADLGDFDNICDRLRVTIE